MPKIKLADANVGHDMGKVEPGGGYVGHEIGDYGHDFGDVGHAIGKVEPDGGCFGRKIGEFGHDFDEFEPDIDLLNADRSS